MLREIPSNNCVFPFKLRSLAVLFGVQKVARLKCDVSKILGNDVLISESLNPILFWLPSCCLTPLTHCVMLTTDHTSFIYFVIWHCIFLISGVNPKALGTTL